MVYESISHPIAQVKCQFRIFGWLALLVVGLCLLMGSMGLIVLLAMFVMIIFTPLLLRVEKGMCWLWLVLYPLFYYDPVRLGRLFFGENTFLTVPMFLMATLPGAILSMLTAAKTHRQLLPVTFPLWILLVGFLLQFFRLPAIFRPDHLVRDMGFVIVSLYITFASWRTVTEHPHRHQMLYNMLMGIGVLNGLTIVVQYVSGLGLIEAGGFMRPIGLFGFPIEASCVAVITLVLSLYQLFQARTMRRQVLFGSFALVLLMGCMMTLTKTIIAQLGLVLIIWYLFWVQIAKKQTIITTTLLLLLVIGIAAGLGLGVEGQLKTQLVERFSGTETWQVRNQAWAILLDDMDWKSLLLGHGWTNDTELLGIHNYSYQLFPVDLGHQAGVSAIHAHNAYVGYLYKMGLLGVAVIGAYIWLMLRGFGHACNRHQSRQRRLASLSIATVCLLLLITSLTGSLLEQYMLIHLSFVLFYLAHQAGWLNNRQVAAHNIQTIGFGFMRENEPDWTPGKKDWKAAAGFWKQW